MSWVFSGANAMQATVSLANSTWVGGCGISFFSKRSANSTQMLVEMSDGSDNARAIAIHHAGNYAQSVRRVPSEGFVTAETTASISGTGWNFVAARQINSTTETAAFANTEKVTAAFTYAWSNGNAGPTTITQIDVNQIRDGTPQAAGKLAHIVIWKEWPTDTELSNISGGQNPMAVASSKILEYWHDSKTGEVAGYTLTDTGTGTVTWDGADNPVVDDPPGGDASAALSGSASTGGHGTASPVFSIGL